MLYNRNRPSRTQRQSKKRGIVTAGVLNWKCDPEEAKPALERVAKLCGGKVNICFQNGGVVFRPKARLVYDWRGREQKVATCFHLRETPEHFSVSSPQGWTIVEGGRVTGGRGVPLHLIRLRGVRRCDGQFVAVSSIFGVPDTHLGMQDESVEALAEWLNAMLFPRYSGLRNLFRTPVQKEVRVVGFCVSMS